MSSTISHGKILGTGSSWEDLAAGADLLPGRRGKRYPVDFELLPIGFRDVADRVPLEAYLLTGGFPRALTEYIRLKVIPPYVYELHASWITGLFVKRKKSVHQLPYLLPYLIQHVGSATSVQKLSRECMIGSNTTAEEYLAILERGYSLFTTMWSPPDSGPVSPRKYGDDRLPVDSAIGRAERRSTS